MYLHVVGFGVTIRLLFAGKPRDAHCNALAAEYIKRATRHAKCEMREIDPRRLDPTEAHRRGDQSLELDPAGPRDGHRGVVRAGAPR